MKADEYLETLDAKLKQIAGLISASAIHREVDTNTGIGLLKGQITFVDGSRFEFMEQLPTERTKFRLHYMSSSAELLVRWDSAPHHKELNTFPFHKHTAKGVEAHAPMTMLEGLDEIAKVLKV
jgi:hypothetical protein